MAVPQTYNLPSGTKTAFVTTGMTGDLNDSYTAFSSAWTADVANTRWGFDFSPAQADATNSFLSILSSLPSGGGRVRFRGDVTVRTGQIPLLDGLWLEGDGYENCSITFIGTNTGQQGLFDGDPVGTNGTTHLHNIRISGIHIIATGGDILWGCNIVRSTLFQNCWLECNSNNYGIINPAGGGNANSGAPGATGVATQYLAEVSFGKGGLLEYDNRTAPTVPMWNLDFRSATGMACNDCEWDYNGGKVFNNGGQTAIRWFRLYGSQAGSYGSRNGRIVKCVHEFPQAGQVLLTNTTGWLIQDLTNEDLASKTVGTNAMVEIGSIPSDTQGCADITIERYSRRGGTNWSQGNPASPLDIKIDSNSNKISIISPSEQSGGGVLSIDCGNSTGIALKDVPTTALVYNTNPATNTAVFQTSNTGFDPQPEDIGVVAWAYDPIGLTGTGVSLTNNTITLIKVPIRFPRAVGTVRFYMTNAGATLTSGQNFAGLYNSAGTRLSTSADQTTAFAGATGVLDVALSTANVFATPPFVWVAILTNGTTPPKLGALSTTASNNVISGTGGVSQARFATNGTGTTLPASITPGSNTKTGNQFWAALLHA